MESKKENKREGSAPLSAGASVSRTRAWFDNERRSGRTDFSNVQFEPNTDFSNLDLAGINFSNGGLEGARFDSSETPYMIFGKEGRYACFNGARLKGAVFNGCVLSDIGFVGADITDSVFKNCYLEGEYLEERIGKGASFNNAIVTGALFIGALWHLEEGRTKNILGKDPGDATFKNVKGIIKEWCSEHRCPSELMRKPQAGAGLAAPLDAAALKAPKSGSGALYTPSLEHKATKKAAKEPDALVVKPAGLG